MTMISPKNPLGSKASLYLTKEPKNGSIHLIPDEETLEFYPTGYTKVGNDGKARQDVLKEIWNLSVSRRTENMLYPLGNNGYNIRLVHQYDNPKDSDALYVVIESPNINSQLSHLDGIDIGWCPMRISKEVHKNLGMIRGGRILKIRAEFHKKYYTAKVIFGYGKSGIISTDLGENSRFIDIMDEIG